MRIIFFRLKGYIKVLNGMGLDEITIPFAQFKNRIILIQGENGCSKSTIISALSPNPDSSDNFRTDVYVDQNLQKHIIEYPAEKEIHYTDGSNIYKILIQSIVNDSKTQRSTKAYISKNNIELNPNGNVSSFKDIRNTLLGIDPVYLDLSSIGSENRGIVDMIPSERRKYMASYVGSLETYNNIFKIISKKSNSCKSYIDILNSKIIEIGNENELRLQLSQLNYKLKNLNTDRDTLLKQSAEEELNIRLLDSENNNQILFSSLLDKLQKLDLQIKQKSHILDKIPSQDTSEVNLDIIIQQLENQLKAMQIQSEDVSHQIATNIALNNSISESIESDKNMLYGLQSNVLQSNIEETVSKLKYKISIYKEYLSDTDISLLQQFSIEQLTNLQNVLNSFVQDILVIEERYDQSIYEESIEYVFNGYKDLVDNIEKLKEQLSEIKIKISKTTYALETLRNEYNLVLDCKNIRPKECRVDSCPYISKYILLDKQHNFLQELKDLQKQLDTYLFDQHLICEQINHYTQLNDMIKQLSNALEFINTYKSIIQKIPQVNSILDKSYLKEKLLVMYKFSEFNIISTLIEKSGIHTELKQLEDQLNNLNRDLKFYNNNLSLIEKLTKSINKNEKIYFDRIQQNKQLTSENDKLKQSILEISNQIEVLKNSATLLSEYNTLLTEKNQIELQIQTVQNNIKIVKEKQLFISECQKKIQDIESQISPTQDSIHQLTYLLANLIEYRHELEEYSEQYNKILFIKNACSPGNGMGIQSEYVKLYMNNIICDCNQLLQYMFNGGIQLLLPIINEKQFSIPFIGPNGITVPDISNGSTAQKCMIGLVFACIAMVRSSTKYNIPRFDEIDGGLDPNNRIVFINILNQILDFMKCDQCIICSHNTEFDTQSTTRLLCSKQGITIEQ